MISCELQGFITSPWGEWKMKNEEGTFDWSRHKYDDDGDSDSYAIFDPDIGWYIVTLKSADRLRPRSERYVDDVKKLDRVPEDLPVAHRIAGPGESYVLILSQERTRTDVAAFNIAARDERRRTRQKVDQALFGILVLVLLVLVFFLAKH